ncbi:MAG: Gfo/Idh/MocA family oxidoreductase [Candidatus Thiodiazotropha sp.]
MKNIALIGVGKMGLSHLSIANMTPGIKVVGICDVSTPLMFLLSRNIKVKTYRNYRKMITELNPDGVLICVPNSMHFDIAKYCIEKKINVFIEKPLTLSYEQSAKLAELADQYQVKGQVGYVNRFNPIFRKIKKMLELNVIGEVNSYNNKMTGNVIVKENSIGWRNDYTKGGGCLFDYGPHCFDLSTYFFGYNVKVTSASLKSIFSTKVDDMVQVSLVHDSKIQGNNYINWSDHSVRKASNSIEITGSRGEIFANKQEARIFLQSVHPDTGLKEGWNSIYITDENTDTNYYLRGEDFSFQMQEFSDLLNGNIQNPVSSLGSAKTTDRLIDEVFQFAGGVVKNG